jgi:hypothetical protein
MVTSDEFEIEYNEVLQVEHDLSESIRGKYPFSGSAWKRTYMSQMNTQDTHGDLLRSTFLSGGSLHMPFVMYRDSLRVKAADIQNKVVLTDAEIAHNCEGIRLFFELDYRTSTTPLPQFSEMLEHIKLTYRTVCECFPSVQTPTMHIATCTKKRKQKRSSEIIELAWGAHLVFPDIIVTTPTMRLIAQLVDTRMSKLFPLWPSIVDPASYRSSNATLRPCYSFKMVPCSICERDQGHAKMDKRKRDNTSDDVASMFRKKLTDDCRCFNGRIVDPSVYTYTGSIRETGGDIVQLVHGVLDTLEATSIVPMQMGMFTSGFTRPVDMGDELDKIPDGDSLFPAERRLVSGFQRRKNLDSLSHGEHTQGFEYIRSIVARAHVEFQHLALHKVSIDRVKRSLLVTVKGKGSRFCPYKGNFHHSNRIYFSVQVKRARVQIHCFDADCRKGYGDKPISRVLTVTDCATLERDFKLPISVIRPSISPVVGLHDDSVNNVAVVAVDPRTLWEQRRAAFIERSVV